MLADMAIGVETARLATYRAAWEVDQVSTNLPVCITSEPYDIQCVWTNVKWIMLVRTYLCAVRANPAIYWKNVKVCENKLPVNHPPSKQTNKETDELTRKKKKKDLSILSFSSKSSNVFVFVFVFSRAVATLTLRPSPSVWPEMSLTNAPQTPFK